MSPSPEPAAFPHAGPPARRGLTVFVRGLRIDAGIGVHDHELGRLQPLVIDVTLDLGDQTVERLASKTWRQYVYEGQFVDLVFTTPSGGLVARQHIDKLVREVAAKLDIDTRHLGTHVGRRTVVTVLFEAGASVEDIAQHVGHASAVTTRGYIARQGDRPAATAALAARLLGRS